MRKHSYSYNKLFVAVFSFLASFEAFSASLCGQAHYQNPLQNVAVGKPIPKSLFNRLSTEELSLAIVRRVGEDNRRFMDAGSVSYKPIDLQKDTDIILFFKSQDIPNIAEMGFKSVHSTKKNFMSLVTSNLKDYIAGRTDAENVYTSLLIGSSEKSNLIRPKSAFLNIRSNEDLGIKTIDAKLVYGDIGAVLKPEVKTRSTWTAGDSLDIYGLHENQSPSSLMYQGVFSDKQIAIHPKDQSYYEAQVYGELQIKDVDYFLVKHQRQQKELERFGKPIYLIKTEVINGRFTYKKGAQLNIPEGILKPTVSATAEMAPYAKLLTELNIGGEVVLKSSLSAKSGNGAVVRWLKTDLNDYFLFGPSSTAYEFSVFTTSLKKSMDLLVENGIRSKSIIRANETALLLEGYGQDRLFSSLLKGSSSDKEQALDKLKSLLFSLVRSSIYIKNLRPSQIIIDPSGHPMVLATSNAKKVESMKEAAKLYADNILPLYEKYMNDSDLFLFKLFLETDLPRGFSI